MRSNADELIRALTPAIEQKCGELQRARKERLQSRLFVLLCAMVVFVPALLVFAGIISYNASCTAGIYVPERALITAGSAVGQDGKTERNHV